MPQGLSLGRFGPADHFLYDGPWERVDGVPFADSFAQIHDGFANAPLNVTEIGMYTEFQLQFAWTAVDDDGNVGFQNCEHWTSPFAAHCVDQPTR